MGAQLDTRTFADDDREAIAQEWKKAVARSAHEYGHSYSGAIGMFFGCAIEWHDLRLKDRETAERYILDNHDKYSDPMAVSFKAGKRDPITKKRAIYWSIGGRCAS